MPANDNPNAPDNSAEAATTASQTNVTAGSISDNSGNTALGSGINQTYVAGNQIITNNYGAAQTPSGTQTGAAGAATPLTIIGLNAVMRRSLDEDTMRNICQLIASSSPYCSDLDYNGLVGNGWQNKVLSLIDYCRRRRSLTLLVDTINDARPNAMINPSHDQWHDWAAGEDAN